MHFVCKKGHACDKEEGGEVKRLKLRGRIVEKYGTIAKFAELYGITAQYVSQVLNGKATQKNMSLIGWCTVLDIPENEVPIFFGDDV